MTTFEEHQFNLSKNPFFNHTPEEMATSTTDNSYRSTESNQEGSLMTDKQIAF
jgi:hypothetical protein